MDIDVFPPRELDTVLRVLRTALEPTAALDARERSFLDTYALITGHPLSPDDPAPMPAIEVRIADAHARRRLLQLAAMAALLSCPPKHGSVAYVRELSRALDTRDSVVDLLEALRQGRTGRVRLLAMRRGMRAMLKEAWFSEGLPGVLRYVAALALKAPVNRDQNQRYRRLGLLPEGTLGREYWKLMTEQGFGFPGEPGGIPATLVYHDLGHVLAGHEATPIGEIQQGCFQGGNRSEDGFFFVQFVLLQFHQGVRITPATPATFGRFEPRKVLWAIHRGAQCPIDMTHGWDYWPLMTLTLAQARERCDLLPRLPEHGEAATPCPVVLQLVQGERRCAS